MYWCQILFVGCFYIHTFPGSLWTPYISREEKRRVPTSPTKAAHGVSSCRMGKDATPVGKIAHSGPQGLEISNGDGFILTERAFDCQERIQAGCYVRPESVEIRLKIGFYTLSGKHRNRLYNRNGHDKGGNIFYDAPALLCLFRSKV